MFFKEKAVNEDNGNVEVFPSGLASAGCKWPRFSREDRSGNISFRMSVQFHQPLKVQLVISGGQTLKQNSNSAVIDTSKRPCGVLDASCPRSFFNLDHFTDDYQFFTSSTSNEQCTKFTAHKKACNIVTQCDGTVIENVIIVEPVMFQEHVLSQYQVAYQLLSVIYPRRQHLDHRVVEQQLRYISQCQQVKRTWNGQPTRPHTCYFTLFLMKG